MRDALKNKTMLIVFSGVIVGIIIVFSIFNYRQFFFNKDFLFDSTNRVIVRNYQIDSQWREVSIDPPLSVQRQSQKILIKLPGVKDWEHENHILLRDDGTKIKVEVVLVDQDGGYIELYPISIGASVGFGSSFDEQKTFKAIRLRSDTAIEAEHVDWYCWTGK